MPSQELRKELGRLGEPAGEDKAFEFLETCLRPTATMALETMPGTSAWTREAFGDTLLVLFKAATARTRL